MFCSVPYPVKGAEYEGNLRSRPVCGDCAGMALKLLGKINKAVVEIGNHWQAYLAVIGIPGVLIAWFVRTMSPFSDTGWGWPEAVVLAFAGVMAVGLVSALFMIGYRLLRPLPMPEQMPPAPTVEGVGYDHAEVAELRAQQVKILEEVAALQALNAAPTPTRGRSKAEVIADVIAKRAALQADLDVAKLASSRLENIQSSFNRKVQTEPEEAVAERSRAMYDWLKVKKRLAFMREVDLSTHPIYSSNPMRRVMGDEKLEGDAVFAFRMAFDNHRHIQTALDAGLHDLEAQVRSLDNLLISLAPGVEFVALRDEARALTSRDT